MNYIKAIILFICFFICFYFIGILGRKRKSDISIGEALLVGLIRIFASFEITILPFIFLRLKFSCFFSFYCIMLVSILLYSVIKNAKYSWKTIKKQFNSFYTRPDFFILISILLIVFQMYMSAVYMHIDDDDAFYIGTSVTTLETDTMFQYNAETGAVMSNMPTRYVLSPMPMFIALVSKIFLFPPAVTAHTLLAPIWIGFSYLVFYLIGTLFFRNSKKNLGIYLIIFNIFQILGNYSIYSSSTFILSRGCQGKAILAGILIPAAFYFLLKGCGENKQNWDHSNILMLALASGMVSSMGIMLMPILIGISGILYSIYCKNMKLLIKGLICCLPSIILAVLYLLLKTGRLIP